MSDFQVRKPYVNELVQNLLGNIAKIQNTDPLSKVVVIADSKATCHWLKFAIREELDYIQSTEQRTSISGIGNLLFNVQLMTSEDLIKDLFEESFLGQGRKFLSRLTLLYACQYLKNTWPELNFKSDTLARIYEYIRYQRKDPLVENTIRYLPSSLITQYVNRIYQLIQPNYSDQLDAVKELINSLTEKKSYIELYANHYILFTFDTISKVESILYNNILNITYCNNQNIYNLYSLDNKSTNFHLSNQTQNTSDCDEEGFIQLDYAVNTNRNSTHNDIYTQDDLMIKATNQINTRYLLSESHMERDSVATRSENNLEKNKPFTMIFDYRSINEEVHTALSWILERISMGAKPHECAMIYFGAEYYRQTIRYESSFLQVDYYIDNAKPAKKNTFLELSKLLMRIDPKAVLSSELIELLDSVFTTGGIDLWYTFSGILYQVLDSTQSIGSIGFWCKSVENIITQNEVQNASLLIGIMNILKSCLEEKDTVIAVSEAVVWLGSYIEQFLLYLNSDVDKALDMSYATYKNILSQIEQDAVSIGSSESNFLPDIIDLLCVDEDDFRYPGVYIASAEEACGMPFRFVAILGCSSEVLDNVYRRQTLQGMLDKYLSSSESLRFSYARSLLNTKTKGSVSSLILSLLASQEITYTTGDTKDIPSTAHKPVLYNYSDIIRSSLEKSFDATDLWPSVAVTMPISLYFSLQALSARSNLEFSEYMGYLFSTVNISENGSFSCSATSLERYLKCPFSYFLKDVLGLAGERHTNDYLTLLHNQIGLTVHKILDIYIKIIKDSNCFSVSGKDTIGLLKNYYSEQTLEGFEYEHVSVSDIRSHLSRVLTCIVEMEFGKLTWHGDGIFKETVNGLKQRWLYYLLLWNDRYLEYLLDEGRTTLASEYKFSDEPIMKLQSESNFASEVTVKVSGAIDRIDRAEDDTIYIVDYKTGSSDKYQQLKRYPSSIKKFLQLPLYVNIYSGKDSLQKSYATYDFIAQPEKNIELCIDQEMLNELHSVIGNVYHLIEKGVFPQNPGKLSQGEYENCRNCDYRSVCSDTQRTAWSVLKSNEYVAQYVGISE